MTHDIILALGGIGGDILKNFLNEGMHLALAIHPCEIEVIQNIIEIADKYKTLLTFIKKGPQFGEETIVLGEGSELQPGMYLRAFCNGLHNCLEPYRKHLIKLEKDALKFASPTPTGILADVWSYQPLFTTLNSIVNQIILNKLHGCKILDLLHRHLTSGIDTVDTAVARILQQCHMVLLKQLSCWLLYGNLNDPFSEFFIEACMSTREGLHGSMTTLDSESLFENLLGENSLQEYRIVQEQVPYYIPLSLPEKAKFVGVTVMLFSRDPNDKYSGGDMRQTGSIYDKTEESLQQQLQALQSSPRLDILALERIVDHARSCVTQQLFSLARDKADLPGELRLIRELYLLGRGELFISFLRIATNTMFRSVSTNSGRDLSNLLYTAARDVQLNSDVIMQKFAFKVPPKDSVGPEATVWSTMVLEYIPPWPLHLLFTPAVLATYNTLFNFLLKLKIAEHSLHNVWLENIKGKEKPLAAEVVQLCNCLMFLVHNVQCYMQLDVLETEFTSLVAAIQQTADFEQVIHKHSLFLSHIMAQTFLLSKEVRNVDQPTTTKRNPVNKCLSKILQLCDEFCEEVSKSSVDLSHMSRLSQQLQSLVSVLMTLITVLGGQAPGLSLLLLRLDYNRYFSNLLHHPA